MSDFQNYMLAKEQTAVARANHEAATATLSLCIFRERLAELISQHEPIESLGVDRDALRKIVQFIYHGHLR